MNIGLLEDDQPQSEMLCDWLREEGFTVSVAATGAQFIQLVKSQLFDLLILDWELPDTSGYEVLKQLRGVMTVEMTLGDSNTLGRRRGQGRAG